ncbi:TIGR01457 family HAD-type hydrolase [Gracilibacillus caseinilyticus]|uniref:Acid sugar phosphatase n=1 Tax=Gracilibacillus caseinilyticus TaxID=2932256 RepID=A0ABY4EWT3_9BACI|nr:TIGR01457 family HAD-type hydrolase [Gracilibacillus caseinilyticus]UOQ48880.1 TIGR01457 family HAD-type hydrolase [Gracilibacillus caseinilyticus]
MKNYKGFLIDLDGTVYKGTEKITEAIDFVKELHRKGLPYLFLTNNSTKHPSDVAKKLTDMGVPCETEHVFTTSMATASYIKEQQADAKVCAIGEEGLHMALNDCGLEQVDERADYVVMGLDREITYDKLAKGALNIRAGAKFVATNGDVALPTERGFLPGAGSLISVLSVTTGVEPKFIGKPQSIMVEQALEVLGTSKEDTLMIGDNYATDILAGINAGIDSLLVHTGVTTPEDLKTIEKQPTYTISSLSEWIFAE